MKTTVVINKYILLDNSTVYTVHDGMQSCGIKFCTFCRIWWYHFAVRQQGGELIGATYGRRNRQRNVYASLEVWMLWLGQPPSWVHTGLIASSMNVKCHTKHENRPSLYCSFSSHQKSVSADDKSKHNKPSPSSPEPTSWLWLFTWVTAAAASAIAASQSPQHILCAFLF